MRIFFTCTTSHHGREIRREIDPPTAPPHAKAFPHNDIHLAGDAAYHGKPLLVPAATITELQASEELRAAAETLSKNPASLQLRYLQTLLGLGADQNSTVVFPLPVDIIEPFLKHPRMLESIATALNNSG